VQDCKAKMFIFSYDPFVLFWPFCFVLFWSFIHLYQGDVALPDALAYNCVLFVVLV